VFAEPALTDAASIREVQVRLKDLGYDPGPIDGTDGPLTHKAIHNYLVVRGLAGADKPTPALLVRLRSDKAASP
jgi:peptidoglycan hydrolase-like protein with peptidoglycan-binding domain